MGARKLIFDESGNLGSSGRYFVIACIDTNDSKPLHNVMKKSILKARERFPELVHHSNELKANEVYPCVKYYMLEKIVSKDVRLSYIVADLNHVKEEMKKDKNLLYNYLMKVLIDQVVGNNYKNKPLLIVCDNKTIKVNSKNSFSDHIKLHLNYDRGLNLDITVEYKDSNAKDAYVVQAADYIANAIYACYEYGNSQYLYDVVKPKLVKEVKFPIEKFGK